MAVPVSIERDIAKLREEVSGVAAYLEHLREQDPEAVPKLERETRQHITFPGEHSDQCAGCATCNPCIDPICARCHPRERFAQMTDTDLRAELERHRRIDRLMLQHYGSGLATIEYRALVEECARREKDTP
jgi:hypothetical protein